MKKLLALLLALVMIVSMVACSTSQQPSTTDTPKTDSPASDTTSTDTTDAEEPKELESGQAVRIPPDVKHWHGAAPHEAFSHLAFMIADGTGDATNEWLEPVDPDAYGTLR